LLLVLEEWGGDRTLIYPGATSEQRHQWPGRGGGEEKRDASWRAVDGWRKKGGKERKGKERTSFEPTRLDFGFTRVAVLFSKE